MTHTVAQSAMPHCSHYYYVIEQVWIPQLEADVGNKAWGAQVSGITGQVFPVNLMAPQLHPDMDLKETRGTVNSTRLWTHQNVKDTKSARLVEIHSLINMELGHKKNCTNEKI